LYDQHTIAAQQESIYWEVICERPQDRRASVTEQNQAYGSAGGNSRTAVSRTIRVVAVFVGVALLWGFGSAKLGDAADWNPLVAPVSMVLVLAAFGWMRRGYEILDVVAPAFAVSYAAYAGLVIERLSQANVVATNSRIAPLVDLWPVVLFTGVPFALILTVFVAVPASMIPQRGRTAGDDHARFWSFVQQQNEALLQPPKRFGDDQPGASRTVRR